LAAKILVLVFGFLSAHEKGEESWSQKQEFWPPKKIEKKNKNKNFYL
jgi:hypothetical protein